MNSKAGEKLTLPCSAVGKFLRKTSKALTIFPPRDRPTLGGHGPAVRTMPPAGGKVRRPAGRPRSRSRRVGTRAPRGASPHPAPPVLPSPGTRFFPPPQHLNSQGAPSLPGASDPWRSTEQVLPPRVWPRQPRSQAKGRD